MTVHVAIGKATGLTGLVARALAGRDLSRGVLLKPNIVFPVKESSLEITRHRVVRAVVAAVRTIDPSVEVAFGEGTAAGTDPEENFRVSRYANLAAELGVPLIDLHAAERIAVPWRFGRLRLPRIALERTLINLPILKGSSAVRLSGAMKNLKGLLPASTMKGFHREGLHERLAHLATLVRPDLTLLDISPFCGREAYLAGDDACAIDRVAASLFSVGEPDYIAAAKALTGEERDPATAGDDPACLRRDFSGLGKEYRRFLRLRLWSTPGACSMCRFALKRYLRFPPAPRPREAAVTARLLAMALSGTEVLFGRDPAFRAEYGRIVCFGDCTAPVAEGGLPGRRIVHVPGCPPTLDDVVRHLRDGKAPRRP